MSRSEPARMRRDLRSNFQHSVTRCRVGEWQCLDAEHSGSDADRSAILRRPYASFRRPRLWHPTARDPLSLGPSLHSEVRPSGHCYSSTHPVSSPGLARLFLSLSSRTITLLWERCPPGHSDALMARDPCASWSLPLGCLSEWLRCLSLVLFPFLLSLSVYTIYRHYAPSVERFREISFAQAADQGKRPQRNLSRCRRQSGSGRLVLELGSRRTRGEA
jgi:hypothetical protein